MTKPASRLTKVEKKRLRVPLRFVIYGPEGVGKSSLAADAPSPIWLDIEDGSSQLEVARYPFRDGDGGHVPRGYQDVLDAIADLTANEHPHQTLVIDTVDRLEALMWQWMVARDSPKAKQPITNIEGYGYGKGYQAAVDEWRALCLKLDGLRAARGMSIVLLAHAQVRPFKNPVGDDYDRFQLRVNDKAAGFLKEWADVTGFACFEEGASSLYGDRARGVSTGRRLLKLERTAAFDAKSRGLALPAEVELAISHPWAPLARAIEEAEAQSAEALTAAILAECARIGDVETTARVTKAVADAAGNTTEMHRFLINLKNRQPTTTPKERAA